MGDPSSGVGAAQPDGYEPFNSTHCFNDLYLRLFWRHGSLFVELQNFADRDSMYYL